MTFVVRAGHRVIEADSGQEGLKSVEVHQPDLVLLDLNMPGMDGFEVLRTLRSREAPHGMELTRCESPAISTPSSMT